MKDPLVEKINKLKEERKAIIMAHNYQLPDVQDVADYTGDSLELAKIATKAECEVIVFCGVQFMAETAKILNPQRTVLMPDEKAGCPLADMVDINELRRIKSENPGSKVVCYINSHAEVKAESDVCCTSANSVKVVANLDTDKPIIFVPDRHLGEYTAHVTGRELILAAGYCPTHRHIMVEDLEKKKAEMPDAEIIAHPECTTEVLALADHICSTSQMITATEKSAAKRFIVGTEVGMLHVLRKKFPDREFVVPSSRCVCPNMKKTTLEKVLWSLEEMKTQIEVEPDTAKKAITSLERMLEYV